ncbi:fumarylacetoacetate hydrolase family protein [Nonomuraea sp. NPDC048916]|uniref:fumarylacetoacetate hydrolase family protein n=1 Tax=Nonomuraea sp. NPDC048916 TaxID=3154232 RepID=UPI0033FE4DD8
MRWATLRTRDGTRAARREGDVYVILDEPDVGAMLRRPDAGSGREAGQVAVADADYAPLVTNPAKVICVGLNYRSHIEEMGREPPAYPNLFGKYASTLTGARDELVIPSISDQVDWEAELAVVVGRPLWRAGPEEALAAVAGYTVANDISMRDWQWRAGQWLPGKVFDASTPLGPELVTPDEVDHARDLAVTCEVDGVVRQRGRTSDLVFDAATVLSYVSRFTAWQPGDVLLTGTPGGVGAASDLRLAPGAVVTTRVEGVGTCVNGCVADR